MEVKIPESVNVVELEKAPFNNAKDARLWAVDHGIVGKMSNEDTKGKGEISIEISNIEVLTGNAEPVTLRPNIKTSMDVNILLNGVCDVNGAPLLSPRQN